MSYQFKSSEVPQEYFLKEKELNSIYFPNKVGYMDTINKNINENILLVKEDVYANNNFKMETDVDSNNGLLLGITLQGDKKNDSNINMSIKRNLKMFLKMDKNMQRKGIGILIKKEFLEDNLFCHLKDEKRMEIEKDQKHGITTRLKSCLASVKTLTLAKEIYDSPFIGTLNDLYLQSRVYEIIHDELLSIINEDSKSKQNRVILSKDDIEALHKIKTLILKDKKNFSIDELAKKAAINQTKLKYGFKKLFNTTPGNLILETKMYEAKRLLESSEYNVTEVARIAGYKYVQNFSNAFMKFFEVSPKELMKTRKYYY